MKVTLGGDRIGSGKKVKLELHNYFRSTHDLTQTWTSPMTVGALYPFLVIPAMRNDKFEIKLEADTITVPTKGPLFGSFKLQTDIYACPVRLYQAILHNNPTNIGLKMNQVLFPTYELRQDVTDNPYHIGTPVNNSCLWKYLGLTGLGKGGQLDNGRRVLFRAMNAIPLLAYYDIFKNYYANKQEEEAYVIKTVGEAANVEWTKFYISQLNAEQNIEFLPGQEKNINFINEIDIDLHGKYLTEVEPLGDFPFFTFDASTTDGETNIRYSLSSDDISKALNEGATTFTDEGITFRLEFIEKVNNDNLKFRLSVLMASVNQNVIFTNIACYFNPTWSLIEVNKNINLVPFELKNIDDMRMEILSHHNLGVPYIVNGFNKLPYIANNYEDSQYPLNGLVVKTYQSDIFNNWVNTEWIDGENGIAEITKIATSDGAFKLDQLNLAEKLYNMLNRVAVSGGTYEDWQDAVYDEAPHKHIESPIYLGGMSSEIVFEQIVANTAASTPEGVQPLGDLAGRGRYIKRKGGNISVKCDEACFIIGIVSITPRIKYTQGNEFYLTELKSMDDLHKPALDGIGFQNLLGERLAWFDTTQAEDGKITRSIVGKLPAWIEYMTAVDKAYGDFAELEGKAFMSLNRNYEMDYDGSIRDVTTYIDPTKYNYAFAYSKLDAQNFWTEIDSKITARRKMSAKQIPNL